MKRLLTAVAAVLVSGSMAFAQTGGVRGKILDDKGQPLEGVVVKMEFQGGVTLVFDNKTNRKGEFMQIGLRPGSWKFTYTKEGYSPFASPYRIALGDATVLPEVKLLSASAAKAAAGVDDIQKTFGDAVAKLQAGDYDGAIAAFDAMILKNPSLAEAYYNKGFAQYQKKSYEGAEASLKRALEVKADYSDARVLLSNIYTAQGMKDKAVEVMSNASGSSDPRQLFNLGLALLNSGKTEEATAAFQKVEAADPSNSEVQYYLATAALNAGKTDECVTRLEKYLAMGPKSDQNKATATGLLGALKKK
ncbi:MAG: tetratricopeptide repeat protein [Vicinamibacteria bacterium]|nr:tetratricopeptide repeat protein [Vicinamibacteria bacterium]